ncbi:hypothetical protein INS49_006053 [Diaporthe citri]|uniref:uncharacterized protein n=1 Tax=Diaporthe citri TaxID=83186 RepID=UPI001C7FBB8D|nr:uncharacterized protein INS49_006053 [Diaporthe citri]KAG6364452.1 hypothetical protein INS49_006053 [Diaporthe citri]
MAEPLSEDAERRIIEDEGMSVDSLWKNRPTRTEDVKVARITETTESEKRKTEERKSGAQKYIRWMTIYDARHGSQRSIEIEVDEGSVANFLTRGMALDYGCEVQSLKSEPFQGQTINTDFQCWEYVELTLVGKEHKPVVAKFYVLPSNKPPNDPRITKPLVGRHLKQEAKHLLLTKNPDEPVRPIKMGQESAYMKEQSKQEAAKVQKYQANAARSRDAAWKKQDGEDQNQPNRGSSSGTQNEQGK